MLICLSVRGRNMRIFLLRPDALHNFPFGNLSHSLWHIQADVSTVSILAKYWFDWLENRTFNGQGVPNQTCGLFVGRAIVRQNDEFLA